MDESEEWEQLKREADAIDPYQYRRRRRYMAAVALGAFGALLVWGVLELADRRRNPCQRVRDYFCHAGSTTLSCTSYSEVFHESVEDPSAKMRSLIRAQCQAKIERLKTEENVRVP